MSSSRRRLTKTPASDKSQLLSVAVEPGSPLYGPTAKSLKYCLQKRSCRRDRSGTSPSTGRGIVKEDLPASRWDKILKFCGSRAVLAPATRGWTYKGYLAAALRREVSLTSDKNAFHNVCVAVEDGRSRIASISVEIGHEKRVRLVVPNRGATRKLCRQSARMPNDVDRLRIFDSSRSPNLHDAVVGNATIDANNCPIRSGANLLSPDDGYTAVDLLIADHRFCNRRIAHAESENEADVRHVAGIHAMPGSGDNVGSDQEAGTKRANRLVSKTLPSTQIVRRAETARF
jgi:hypothetical protein